MNKQEKIYAGKILKYGMGVKAMKWKNYRSAAERYRELVKDLELNGKSILDVGCGTGNLLPYLCAKSANFEYLGVDLVGSFIEEAKKRYPDFNFDQKDYLKNQPSRAFDIIFCSGTFNSAGMSLQYKKSCIKKLFNKCHYALAFNMAGSRLVPKSKDKSIGYVDSLQVLDFCFSLTKKLIFRQSYNEKDFTVILFK